MSSSYSGQCLTCPPYSGAAPPAWERWYEFPFLRQRTQGLWLCASLPWLCAPLLWLCAPLPWLCARPSWLCVFFGSLFCLLCGAGRGGIAMYIVLSGEGRGGAGLLSGAGRGGIAIVFSFLDLQRVGAEPLPIVVQVEARTFAVLRPSTMASLLPTPERWDSGCSGCYCSRRKRVIRGRAGRGGDGASAYQQPQAGPVA